MSNTKSYESFVASLKSIAAEMGAPVKFEEKKGWVLMQSTVNEHKFYVPKSAGTMGLCETTIPLLLLGSGASPLDKPNGKIQAKFVADLGRITDAVLPLMAQLDDRLPPNRKPPGKATLSGPSVASHATPGKFPGSSQENPSTIDDLIADELEAAE